MENIKEKIINEPKGITLIALIITIIILLILAGVTINVLVGENGLFSTAKRAGESYDEAAAREKLETVLVSLQAEKITNPKYNEQIDIDNRIIENDMSISGNIVIVDGWQFEIDRSIPKIVSSLGKGKESSTIEIISTVNYSSNFETGTISITITSSAKLSTITINGETVTSINNNDGTYTVEKEITDNGVYNIYVKDINDEYKLKNIKILGIQKDITIMSTEDIIQFREVVNNGGGYKGKTVTLGKDLDLSSLCYKVDGTVENDVSWTPIGTETKSFKGTFNGNNKTINGLYINSNTACQGLFGVIEKGMVKDLTIKGNISSSQANIGMLSGKTISTTIENIIIGNSLKGDTNTVKSTIKSTGGNVGGAVGRPTSSKINKCLNYADIEGLRNVGGLFGYCDELNYISKCGNIGNIIASQGFAGGLLGSGNVNVKYCYNRGDITGNGTPNNDKYTSSGGICGGCNGNIEYCYNTGSVYGAFGQVAGICGNIYNYSSATIRSCYNIGIITGSSRIGSIMGECNSSTIVDCYWTSTQNCRGNGGTDTNCRKLSDDEMKAYTNKAFVLDNVEPLLNDGYPVLYWEKGLTLEEENS